MPGGKKAEYAYLFDAMGEIMKKFDITAIGEILIDFTPAGKSQNGRTLFEENPGGATANVAAAATLCVSRYGAIPALTSLSETEKLLASFPCISGKQP
ncbi:hypothetical protein [Treponema socranskii]|uniref:hypothetical protein n=1 Tax=Treponema socranskii TaxID=53419 RepID=UPI003D915E32